MYLPERMPRKFFSLSKWRKTNIWTEYEDEKILEIFKQEIKPTWVKSGFFDAENNNCADFVHDFVETIATKQTPINWPGMLKDVTEYNRDVARNFSDF